MKDLEIKSKMYDNPSSVINAPKNYPRVYLPMSLTEGMNLKPGDTIALEFEAEVDSMMQDQYRDEICFILKKGEAETLEEQAKEEKEAD